MYDLDQNSEFKSGSLDDFGHLDTRKTLCIVALVVAPVIIVYGCIEGAGTLLSRAPCSWCSPLWSASLPDLISTDLHPSS